MSTIAIYGATGFTGTLIARRLLPSGVRLRLAGRDRRRLLALADALSGDVEVRAAEVHDPEALCEALTGADLVVSCAGPFSVIGEPVVRAAIDCGVPYVDTTGEQHFVRDIYERYESAARRARIPVVSSLGFEVALGDFLASRAAAAIDPRPLDELVVAYAVNRFRPSRGTQLSALESLKGPACVWVRDRWDPDRPARERRTFAFPAFGSRQCVSFPSAEVITVPRHVEALRVQTYLGLSGDSALERLVARATGLLGPAATLLARGPLAASARALLGATPAAPSEDDRDDTTFAIVAEAVCGFETSQAALWGRDIYGVTAEIIAYAALDLLGRSELPAGVLAPSEVFDPERALAVLAERCNLELSHTSYGGTGGDPPDAGARE